MSDKPSDPEQQEQLGLLEALKACEGEGGETVKVSVQVEAGPGPEPEAGGSVTTSPTVESAAKGGSGSGSGTGSGSGSGSGPEGVATLPAVAGGGDGGVGGDLDSHGDSDTTAELSSSHSTGNSSFYGYFLSSGNGSGSGNGGGNGSGNGNGSGSGGGNGGGNGGGSGGGSGGVSNGGTKNGNKNGGHMRLCRLAQLMELMPLGSSVCSRSAASTSTAGSAAGSAAAAAAGAAAEEPTCSEESLSCSLNFQSQELLLDLETGDEFELEADRDEFGTQRVYKKTSPNCVLTLYLPTREITLTGNNPSVLRGIVYVDPKAIQGYRVYAQLTLTFRYGREDEEVMGLRFCNEAIMSLHQIWPRLEEPTPESLSPLQEALMKRLGDGAHPFTLSLSAHAPPSVQLVPAKRYYGAPIGTSYDVRCFIADKTDEKFHRRASVKMGVRVIYRTDVFNQSLAPEHFAAFAGGQHGAQSPPASSTPPTSCEGGGGDQQQQQQQSCSPGHPCNHPHSHSQPSSGSKQKSKSERGDSFPKLRLSPKSFRFSGRFGRSKSEIEKCPNDPFHNYSKSFQEHCDSMLPPHTGAGVTGGIGSVSVGPCGGPQGSVDKPFLLHDGRVGLKASLDKGWYTHGEDVNVTVQIRNDSRKTVRKVRVCAIQHVDVCMFNNGKFKNVVADSDNITPPVDRTVAPGASLNTVVKLRPQRGPTKNWIALEDTLQRSTEPEEITGAIAASAIRSPHFVFQNAQLLGGHPLASPGMVTAHPHQYQVPTCQQIQSAHPSAVANSGAAGSEERNVFAIYVSYYVKVKLTLSGMGGELSLKLPFVLVHVDETKRPGFASATMGELRLEMERLALQDVPVGRRNGRRQAASNAAEIGDGPSTSAAAAAAAAAAASQAQSASQLDRIEAAGEEFNIRVPVPVAVAGPKNEFHKRRLQRSETLARDLEEQSSAAEEGDGDEEGEEHIVQIHLEQVSPDRDEQREQREEPEGRARAPGAETGAVPKSTNV